MADKTDYADQIDAEFLEEARDTISSLEIAVSNMRSHTSSSQDALGELALEGGKLQRLSHWANQPLIDLGVRRMLDYAADLEDPTDRQMDDIDAFLDVIRGILDGEIESADQAEFVRSLPVRRPVDLDDLDHLDIEILLVDPQSSSAKIFTRELVNCGYRVTTCNRAFEALELTVRTLPDMVISSAVLDEISGVELGCALAAMDTTTDIPFAVMTSFSRSHASLKNLPEKACLLRKDNNFGEDLADALEQFGIM